jgi:D-beta-D-heptose 7-phosphate kinase/D-beta-D-heptose 1-phosphate adenosyltransferase
MRNKKGGGKSNPPARGKVLSLSGVLRKADALRRGGKRIVATNGCFDILHVGHIRSLKGARALGDALIVGINSDASVRKNKGPSRPIVPERERAEMLAALESVDYVFIFGSRTPFAWIRKLGPDVHVKGGGRDVLSHPDFPAQKKTLDAIGARFVLIPHSKGKSTSAIINKIKKL